MATTPSRPAPSNVSNQRCAVSASRVMRGDVDRRLDAGERRLEPRPPLARTASPAATRRRGPAGRRRRSDAGVCSASRLTRDSAGWIRCSSVLEVQPVAARDDDLAVDDALLRQVRLDRRDDLGEVPGQRALVAAAQLDLVAVPEDDAAEAVPLGLVVDAVTDRAASSPPWPASASPAACTGRSMRVSQAGMRRSGAWPRSTPARRWRPPSWSCSPTGSRGSPGTAAPGAARAGRAGRLPARRPRRGGRHRVHARHRRGRGEETTYAVPMTYRARTAARARTRR